MAEIVQTGQVVNDRYRVVRKLGGGGMADVYLCEDLTLGRKVALKVLQTRYMGDEQFVERFRREAKAAAGFSHPNLVAIFDWGALDGTYYIVMEYVEGETLKELIRRRGRLSGNEAVTTALGLLAALSYAHTHGVVHRDIKSQNILIDQAGTVKVTDFGIAHAGDHGMTEAGSILGTAQYLAPEQARGERVDERSDLYSVGVVLFEMLTGQVPFKGDSAVTVALKHVNTMPPEPAELVPGLPYALNQIVMKALAKDPEQRYQNADEFSRDLNAAQTGAAVTAATFDLAAERTELMQAGPAGATQVMPAAGPPPRRRSRRALWITLILLAVIAAAAAALFLLMGGEKAAGARRGRPQRKPGEEHPPGPGLQVHRQGHVLERRRQRLRRAPVPRGAKRRDEGFDGRHSGSAVARRRCRCRTSRAGRRTRSSPGSRTTTSPANGRAAARRSPRDASSSRILRPGRASTGAPPSPTG